MCPGAEAGISNFLRRDKTSSFLLGFKGGRGGKRVPEEILNDDPVILALSLYFFILVFWPLRFLHTSVVYRNVFYAIHLQNNITS